MNHQPYKTWILLQPDLSEEQQTQLEDHLQHCQTCRGLAEAQLEVSQLFQDVPTPSPQPGFSERWKLRIAERIQKQKLRTARITLLITFVITLLILISLGLQLRSQLPPLSHILLLGITQTARWVLFLDHLRDILLPFLGVGLKLIPRSWLFSLWLGISAAVLLLIIPLTQHFLSRQEGSK